jgi:16S rRNA (cytosine967-C5)-methyltransferase
MIAPARVAAYEVLRAVNSGRSDLPRALVRVRDRLGDERDRALTGEIATGTLRWQGTFDHVIAALSGRPLAKLDPEILDILRLTLFQLLHLDRVPASAAVNDAVALAKRAGKRSAAPFVNALARRASRQRGQLPLPPRPGPDGAREEQLAYLTAALSHPRWLAERWLDRDGFEAAEAWMRFNNAPAPLTLRVNSLRGTVAEVSARLAAEGVDTVAGRYAPEALIVVRGQPLASAAYADGLVLVQDEASQLVGLFAGAEPGERVFDACASPGGKTLALLAAMGGSGLLVAADVRDARVALLEATLRRGGGDAVRVLQADASRPLPFGPVFDRVLLDAPCSGLGTLRRDPDLKWRRRAEELPKLAAAQRRMIDEAFAVLRPGGTLVYATCSSEPEENEDVVRTWLQSRPDARLVSPPRWPERLSALLDSDGCLRTLPHRDGLEAFFAAAVEKSGASR